MAKVDTLVQVLWDYMLVGHELRPADCIFVLGSYDIRVADHAVTLFKDGYSPWLLFSGGVIQQNAALKVFWDTTEAEYFARRAIVNGVPAERILIENQSTNTGENFLYTRQLLDSRGLDFQSFIMVQKPYMERRVLATALKQWSETDFVVASPPISCADYLNRRLATRCCNSVHRRRFPACQSLRREWLPGAAGDSCRRLGSIRAVGRAGL